MYTFVFQQKTWKKFRAPKGVVTPKGRRSHTATVFKDSMFIYGGYKDLKGSTSEMWTFHFGELQPVTCWLLKGRKFIWCDKPFLFESAAVTQKLLFICCYTHFTFMTYFSVSLMPRCEHRYQNILRSLLFFKRPRISTSVPICQNRSSSHLVKNGLRVFSFRNP